MDSLEFLCPMYYLCTVMKNTTRVKSLVDKAFTLEFELEGSTPSLERRIPPWCHLNRDEFMCNLKWCSNGFHMVPFEDIKATKGSCELWIGLQDSNFSTSVVILDTFFCCKICHRLSFLHIPIFCHFVINVVHVQPLPQM